LRYGGRLAMAVERFPVTPMVLGGYAGLSYGREHKTLSGTPISRETLIAEFGGSIGVWLHLGERFGLLPRLDVGAVYLGQTIKNAFFSKNIRGFGFEARPAVLGTLRLTRDIHLILPEVTLSTIVYNQGRNLAAHVSAGMFVGIGFTL